MTAHKHAALMLQYAQDAAETDRPWERWEWLDNANNTWCPCSHTPIWEGNAKYRRKPQVIRVGRHEFPKPISKDPLNGINYFFIRIGKSGFEVADCNWANDKIDNVRLESGLVHLTREAAQAHADVLNALCRGDID